MSDHPKYSDYINREKDTVSHLTDHLPVGIYRTTLDGKIIYANQALANMLEYNIKEILNIAVKDLYVTSKERESQLKLLTKTSNTSCQEINLKTKNGNAIIARDTMTTVKDASGNIIYFDGILEDITKRKNIEKEILSLSTAITQSPASVVITNLDGNIEYVNQKFTDITGYTYDEAIGQNPRILKTEHTSSNDYKEMWETISSGGIWRGEFLNKRKDGTFYWELASVSPIIDKDGNIIKYLAIKEDITERKKTEDALIKSEKELSEANATKNIFFSVIAHDLKGPLGSFLQLLNLFKENFNDISNKEKLNYINILIGLSSKTNNLLDDLLLWARIQMNTLDFSIKTVKLKTLIQNSIGIVKEKAIEKNIKIKTFTDNNITVHVNGNSVKTIIRNLLSNAIKFSHKNSSVKINTKVITENNTVEISIEDSGIGISEKNIEKLFKIETTFSTYGTEKEKGTGLGLIICKELVEKNGGAIRVESKEDSGSTFFFTLLLT